MTDEALFSEIYELTVENTAFGPNSDSGLRHEVIDMLRTGWSPARVARYLRETLGLEVSVTDVAQFREVLPPAALLPPGKLAKRLQQVDLEIDALGELARAIRIAEDRLDTAITVEEASQAHNKSVDKLLNQYTRLLQEYAQLKMRMGLIPEEPAKLDVTSAGESVAPTLRELHARVQRARSKPDPEPAAQ